MASTIPKSVSVLIEKPNSLTKAKVPTSETGIVMAGISVLRQFCRNTNITRITSAIASTSVTSTSLIDSRTTPTLSKASRHSSPGGKLFSSRAISRHHAWYTSSALAVGSSWMPMPEASSPMKRRLAE